MKDTEKNHLLKLKQNEGRVIWLCLFLSKPLITAMKTNYLRPLLSICTLYNLNKKSSLFKNGIKVLATANTFAVVLTVGVLLRFSRLKAVLSMTAVAGFLKLILKPVMVCLPTLAMNIPHWQAQVLVIEAAMPSAMLSVVLASSYGCDAKLASKLVFTTTLGSGITVPLMFRLLA